MKSAKVEINWRSKVEDHPSDKLEIVLVLAEEAGAQVVGFKTESQSRTPTIVGAAAQHYSETIPAVSGDLGLFVYGADQAVQPGLPDALPPSDLGPTGVGKKLDVLVGEDLWSER